MKTEVGQTYRHLGVGNQFFTEVLDHVTMIGTDIGHLAVSKQVESFLPQVMVQFQPSECLVFRPGRPIIKLGLVVIVIPPAGGPGGPGAKL